VSRSGAEISQTIIDGWREQGDFELMTCQEQLSNPTCFYDTDGNLMCSFDGGATYVNSNDRDPRYTTPSLPGLTGDNAACRVADSIEDAAKDFRTKVAEFLNIGGLAIDLIGIIVAALAAIFGFEVAIPLIMDFVASIIALTGDELLALITDGYMATFRCIIYCQLSTHVAGEAGEFKVTDIPPIIAAIDAQITDAIPRLFFVAFAASGGLSGARNAAHYANFPGDDCDGCDCTADWCRLWNLNSTSLNGWTEDIGDTTTEQVITVASAGTRAVQVSRAFDPPVHVSGVNMNYSYDGLGFGAYHRIVLSFEDSTVYDSGTSAADAGTDLNFNPNFDPELEIDTAVFTLVANSDADDTGDGGITYIDFTGTQTPIPPDGLDCI